MIIRETNEPINLTQAYKNDLKKFMDRNIDNLKSIATKCGFRLYADYYYRQTYVDYRNYETVLCCDFDSIYGKTSDIKKFDKELNKYFKKFDFRYFIEELPRVTRFCIYY